MASSRRNVAIVVRAEIAAYKRDMAELATVTRKAAAEAEQSGYKATSAFGKLEQRISANTEGVNSLANGLGIAGAALVGFAGLAVARFAEFDAAMSNVQAATSETAANMDRLREAALAAGAETVYSATEAAAAIEELAKAGVSTSDILNGGLSGALNLAASDNIAVAEAAEIAASAMTQFGLVGSDVGQVADQLAAGAAAAQGGVADLGAALNQSGLVAGQFGLSVQESVGTLTAFASAGLLGSDAGTSFRSMLLRLANPTEEVKDLMAELGFQAYDAQGNFVGMEALAGNLTTALQNMTQAERDQTLAMIFGSDAIRAANILLTEGEQGISDWIDTVDQQGFAAEQAATKLNNLKGDLEGLSGAFETALINMGSGGDGILRSLVQGTTDVVDNFNRLPSAVQQGTLAIAGGGGLALLGVAGLGKLAVSTTEAMTAMRSLGILTEKTSARMGKLVSVSSKVAGAAVGFLALAKVLDGVANASHRVETSTELMANALNGVGEDSIDDVFAMTSGVDGLSDSFTRLTGTDATNSINRWASSTFGFLNLTDGIQDARDQFDALGVTLAGMDPENAAEQFDSLVESLGGGEQVREQLLELMPAYRDALAAEAGAAAAGTEASEALVVAQEQQEAAMQALLEVYSDASGAFIDALGAYDSIIAKNQELAEATASATESSKDSWEDYYDGVTVARDDYLAALDEQVAAQEAWQSNMLLLAGRVSQGSLDYLAGLGPEGAALVGDLVNYSEDELDRWEAAITASSTEATNAWANSLVDATPVLAAIGSQLGQESSDAAAAALESGEMTLQQVIDKYKLKGVTFPVEADTSVADTEMARFLERQRRQQIVIQARVDADPNYDPAYSPAPVRRAGGGEIRGPGTATSDSILARLSNGEHVLSARDVSIMGGQAGVYAFRSALHSGIAGFATGGAVGATQLELLRAQQRIRDIRRQLNETEKVDGVTRRSVRGLDRQVMILELGEAQRDLRDLRNQGATARSEEARERAIERASLSGGLSTSLRRGTIRQQVESGGGLSVVDQMLDWANNTAIDPARRRSLRSQAKAAESQLTSLYKRLDSAQETLGDITQVYDSVRNGLRGEFDLGGAVSQGSLTQLASGEFVEGGATGASIAAAARTTADRIRTFAGKLSALRKAGASETLLREIGALGSEAGIAAADALLQDRDALRATNAAYADIDKASQAAGLAVAQGMSGADKLRLKVVGGELGSGLVDSLNKSIGAIGTSLASGFASALGLRVTKNGLGVVKKATGGAVWGPGTATSDSVPALLSNGEHVFTASDVDKAGGHGAIYALRSAIQEGRFAADVRAGRYAAGGHVGAPRTAHVTGAGSTVVVQVAPPDFDGMRISGDLDLGNGLTGFIDGRIHANGKAQASKVRGLHRAVK